jgi:hypothetical protein
MTVQSKKDILHPEYLDDYVAEDSPVRVIDVFVDELDLGALSFDSVIPEATGRPAYHPGALLKIYVYGYMNQFASSGDPGGSIRSIIDDYPNGTSETGNTCLVNRDNIGEALRAAGPQADVARPFSKRRPYNGN